MKLWHDEQAEHDVLGAIYEAALEPQRWQDALAQVGARIGATSSFFFSAHSDTQRTAVCHVHNHAPELARDFLGYWHLEDAWERAARQRPPGTGTVVRSTQLLPTRELKRTAFYNDFIRHHGMETMVGSMLFDGTEPDGMPFTHLCWYRPPGKDDFDDAASAQLQRWLPHFQRALRMQRRVASLSADEHTQALEAIRVASMELDEKGTLHHCNTVAVEFLRTLPAGCVRHGKLRGLGAKCSPGVAEALAVCAPGQPMRLAALLPGEPARVIGATLMRLSGERPGRVGGGERRYLLMVELPRTDGAAAARAVAELFGLTAAETRVLGALLEGKSPAEMAAGFGISVATVRTQISGVLGKTGAKGQGEVVRMVRGV